MRKIANIFRLFWGCVLVAGVMVNIAIGIIDPARYNHGGAFAWPNALQSFWANSVIPNRVLFIMLFAFIELILGVLILSKGKRTKLGLIGAALFGIGLLLLGLGAKRGDWIARIPNLVFEVTIVFSTFFNYDRTLFQTVRPKKYLTRTSVIGS